MPLNARPPWAVYGDSDGFGGLSVPNVNTLNARSAERTRVMMCIELPQGLSMCSCRQLTTCVDLFVLETTSSLFALLWRHWFNDPGPGHYSCTRPGPVFVDR